MAGYDLKEGTYDDRRVEITELWTVFNSIFSTQSKNATSYKFGFMKSILDNLYNVDEELKLNFDVLFSKFTEIYWNLILKYKIRQMPRNKGNKQAYIEKILREAVEKFNIPEGIPFESIEPNIMLIVCKEVKQYCKKCVVGALYEDSCKLFYSFTKKEEWIKMNPIVYEFMVKYKGIIEKLNYFEWAKYLEKINDEEVTSNLINKLDKTSFRNDLSVYRKILFEEFETKNCFYCGKELKGERGIQVDHFIPWSYVKDDKLWNLVLACPECNRKKSDKIPDVVYLDKIMKRNQMIYNTRVNNYKADNYTNSKMIRIYEELKCTGVKKIWRAK